jgi:serine/threonine-protein kinase
MINENDQQKLGNYILINIIETGGMGTVYKAYEPNLDRYVAIKALSPELYNEEYITRFKTEAQAIASVNHPNILQIYSIGEEQRYHYYAMELVMPPRSLKTELDIKKKISIKKSCDYMLQIIKGLNAAYEKNAIVHRDLKPANLLLTSQDKIKIADFGLAGYSGFNTVDNKGENILGTPTHMSPEQIKGKNLDCRSDIYSLGICFYEMLTGKTPYKKENTHSLLIKHINEPLPDIRKINPSIPTTLCKIIEKMTAKDPAQRYHDYKILYKEVMHLRQALSDKVPPIKHIDIRNIVNNGNSYNKVTPPRGSSVTYSLKKSKKSPVTGILAGVSMLVIMGIATAGIVLLKNSSCIKKETDSQKTIKKEPAQKAYEIVREYQINHPINYAKIIKNYEKIITAYPESEWTSEAGRRIAELKVKRTIWLRSKYIKIVKKTDKLLEEGKYKEALENFNEFPYLYINTDTGTGLKKYKQKVKDFIAEKYIKLDLQSKRLCAAKKFDEAIKLQNRVIENWYPETYIRQAKKNIKDIQKTKELYLKEKTEKKYAGKTKDIYKIVKARKYEKAIKAYQKLKKEFNQKHIITKIEKSIKELNVIEEITYNLASGINKKPSRYQKIYFNEGENNIKRKIIFCDIKKDKIVIEFKSGNKYGKTEAKWSRLSNKQIYKLLKEYNRNSYKLALYAKLHQIKNTNVSSMVLTRKNTISNL